MRRSTLLLLPTLLMVGCASNTMEQARQAGAYKSFDSGKPAQRVAECVEFSWQEEAVFGIDASGYLRADGAERFTVYSRGGEYSVDIQGSQGGSKVSYFTLKRDEVAERRLAAVATCL